jgi:ubiquinone/menaquinone biosynthesis C-methylase UbiE
MSETSRHDAWQAGDSYDLYMGRWSRMVAPRFLDWLALRPGLDWLEIGCGTGALSGAIVRQAQPKSVIAIDSSEGFVKTARANVPDPRADFRTGDAIALALPDRSRDAAVAALVLNFIPARDKALAEMRRVVRPGGTVAFYVWDYPGGGMQLMREFWTAAASLDPAARDLTEDKRFPFCTPDSLSVLAKQAGLAAVDCAPVEVPTVFRDFDDYWRPFTLGTGPAPGYCASLGLDARERLKAALEKALPRGADGSIPLKARAWAVRGSVA